MQYPPKCNQRLSAMADLFTSEWMHKFMDEWNKEPELADELANIGFNSSIAYGIDGEESPRGILIIENGRAISAANFDGQAVNWDLRASTENWNKWFRKPPGMMALGIAYTSRKLKFNVGDYSAMIRDPRMAAPFIKSFAVMSRV